MESPIKISVIIPVYNGESYIKKCLDVLMKQDFDEPYEIIIVDDASTDKSREIIKKFKLQNLKLYSLPFNSGQSAARDRAETVQAAIPVGVWSEGFHRQCDGVQHLSGGH